MILRELTKEEAVKLIVEAGLSDNSLPYRGYATTLKNDGLHRVFIGHHPDGRYLLQSVRESSIPAPQGAPEACNDDSGYNG